MKFGIKAIKEKYWVLADQVVVSASAFITNLLLARALGLMEYGKFSAIVMVQLFLLSVTMAFSSQVYQVVFPSLAEPEKQRLTKGMLGQQLVLATVLFSAMLALYSISSPTRLIWIHNNWQLGFMACMATIFYLLQDFLRRVFITQTRGRDAFIIDTLTNLLQLLALAAAWYFNVLTQISAWFIIGFSFVPSIIAAIVLLHPGRVTMQSVRFCFSQQKNKSGWLVGSSILQWGAGYFFVVAAGWWLGVAALGALRLAQYLFGLLNLLLQAIESYVLPRASSFIGSQRAYWFQLLKKCLLIIVPFLLLFSLFARQILQLAGGMAYGQYAFVIYGLSMIYVLMTIGYPVRIAIRSLHLNRAYFAAYILSVTFSLLVAPWLLKNWQLYGVLAGLFCTQAITIGYWLIVLKRKHEFLWKSFI